MIASENYRRAVLFDKPERIPMSFHINAACWHHYPAGALEELMATHPLLFPEFDPDVDHRPRQYALNARVGEPYTDPWGCLWETTDNGITGTVTGHPLAGWDDFDSFTAPDPLVTDGRFSIDWQRIAERFAEARAQRRLAGGSLPHGHTFLTLCDIRGYENLMFDMADQDPRLDRLIEMVEQFNLAIIRRYIDLGADIVGYPEDLGMQVGPMLSPDHFRRYIKPVYQRMMAPAREEGCMVHMHSDGDIRALAEDLVEGGVGILNLQDLVNGIDWIADNFAGRVCIELDIDRQQITPRGTPDQIDALIREEVTRLASPDGGLLMIYGLYPGVPLKNVAALMDAMERYAGFYS